MITMVSPAVRPRTGTTTRIPTGSRSPERYSPRAVDSRLSGNVGESPKLRPKNPIMLMILFVGLMVAGAIGYFTRGNRTKPGYPDGRPLGRAADNGRRPGYGRPSGQWTPGPAGTAEARAEAGHWVDRLGAGLTSLDGVTVDDDGRQRAARHALSDAAERH